METQYLHPTWDHYQSLALSLASSILTKDTRYDEIVAISRGGLTLGHLLSDFLRIPIATISIQSYTDIQTQGELKITSGLQTPIDGKNILLVDDVAESGRTFIRAMEYLKPFNPIAITTVAMYYKPHSQYRPDFFAEQTSAWVLFPYEPTEMILLLTGKLGRQGKTGAEIELNLKSLGYTAEQIHFVKTHYRPKEK